MTILVKAAWRWRRGSALLVATVVLGVTAAAAFAANVTGDGTLVGTTGSDNLAAGNGNDTIYGLGGSDNITAGSGKDLVDGGGACPKGVASGDYPHGLPNGQYCEDGPVKPCGNDNISVGNGNDTVWGNCGSNNINAGNGSDTVYGYGGSNNISAGNGNDTIYLYDTAGGSNVNVGSGKNVVYAQNGAVDTINCGSRNTTVYADRTDRVSSNCTIVYTAQPAGALQRRVRQRPSKRHGLSTKVRRAR